MLVLSIHIKKNEITHPGSKWWKNMIEKIQTALSAMAFLQ